MKNRIILLFLAITMSISSHGQKTQEELPLDPNLRYGVLKNGLTYYIRKNKYPEKRADFYIAQKVGSMQEEDNQCGLAHFLEHMAFNGTLHFPGRKGVLNYLESIGAQFGSNINAYTSFDETVYTLTNIPIEREGVIDSTLLILHDWSSYIELNNKEIDKERLIIKEEWRTRNGAGQRFMEKQLPVIYRNSKYSDRLPIGKMDVIDKFNYNLIKDYYKRWYRPDLQAIIIVGDIDPEIVEKKVKKLFSRIPISTSPSQRIYYSVPDNKETIFSILTDPEESKSTIYYYIKHDPISNKEKNTKVGYKKAIVLNLAAAILSERLAEISKEAESPFFRANVYDSNFLISKTKNAWTTIVSSKEGKEKESLDVILTETERVKQFGFIQSELDRSKNNLLKLYEEVYSNREKQQNNLYVNEYVRSFIDGDAIPGIEYEYDLIQQILPAINLQCVDSVLSKILRPENQIITLTGPQKQDFALPNEEQLKEVIQNVKSKNLTPYFESNISDKLLKTSPTRGKIIKEEYDSLLDITTWILSNGMKVSFKQTNFKDNEILLSSSCSGGRTLIGDNEIKESAFIDFIPTWGGIGTFNITNLKKILSGKNVSLNVFVNNFSHGVNGRSSAKDLETLLQINHLYLTEPKLDIESFSNFRNMLIERLRNLEKAPSFGFQQQVIFAKYANNPRIKDLTVLDIESLDYNKIFELYKRLFVNNSGSMGYSFVGNIDPKLLKSFVEIYLASLPAGDEITVFDNTDIPIKKGRYQLEYTQKMVNQKSQIYINYTGNIERTLKKQISINALKQILTMLYIKTIREAEGGTYGVNVDAMIKRFPKNEASLTMTFDTNPQMLKKLIELIHSGLQDISLNGPNDSDFIKVKESLIKQFAEKSNTNSYWLSVISDKMLYNEDNFSSIRNILQSLSKKQIQDIASKLISSGNVIEIRMNPSDEKINHCSY